VALTLVPDRALATDATAAIVATLFSCAVRDTGVLGILRTIGLVNHVLRRGYNQIGDHHIRLRDFRCGVPASREVVVVLEAPNLRKNASEE